MKKEQYTVQLEPEFVEKLDKFAKKNGLTRSQLMRNILIASYDELALFDKIGLVTAVRIMRDVNDYKNKLLRELGLIKGKKEEDEE